MNLEQYLLEDAEKLEGWERWGENRVSLHFAAGLRLRNGVVLETPVEMDLPYELQDIFLDHVELLETQDIPFQMTVAVNDNQKTVVQVSSLPGEAAND